jgi:hypothetical protein
MACVHSMKTQQSPLLPSVSQNHLSAWYQASGGDVAKVPWQDMQSLQPSLNHAEWAVGKSSSSLSVLLIF